MQINLTYVSLDGVETTFRVKKNFSDFKAAEDWFDRVVPRNNGKFKNIVISPVFEDGKEK